MLWRYAHINFLNPTKFLVQKLVVKKVTKSRKPGLKVLLLVLHTLQPLPVTPGFSPGSTRFFPQSPGVPDSPRSPEHNKFLLMLLVVWIGSWKCMTLRMLWVEGIALINAFVCETIKCFTRHQIISLSTPTPAWPSSLTSKYND